MSLSRLSLLQLNQAIALLKERESLQAQIAKVDLQLRQIENGNASGPQLAARSVGQVVDSGRKPRRRRRGNMQQAILNALKSAGSEGLPVKELALRAKVKASSLNTWLYTTGKTVAGIKKLKPGLFAYHAG